MRKIVALGAGAALALAPALALAQSNSPPSTAPSAAAIPAGTISKAVAALHDIAQVQQKYQGMIDQASPAQKQTLLAQASSESMQAVQSHGLSVEEYTTVLRAAQNDPQLRQRLLAAADLGQ